MKYNIFIKHFYNVFIIIIPLSAFMPKTISAQDLALKYAEQFFEIGNYEEAITEYKRFLYFNPDHEMRSEVYYKLGLAYRNQEQCTETINSLRKSIALSSNDSLKDERKISIAMIKFTNRNYSAAEFELLRVAHFSNYTSLQKKAFFFLSVCYLYTFKWDKSREALSHYISDPLIYEEADSLFSLASNLNYKSPKFAKRLSTFLPGAGQIYCGDWRNGINAFVLNFVTTYLLIDALLDQRYQDVIISHQNLFERYYNGNRYNAERIAKEYNDKMNRIFAKMILDYLQQIVTSSE